MNNNPKRATIHDVAQLAKVSIKTVSRVINQEPSVRKQTAEKVLHAIKQLDYQPSLSARSLAGNNAFNIALVYSFASPSYIFDVQSGALEACKGLGYELIIHPSFSQGEALIQELTGLFVAKKIDGLLLLPPMCDDESLIHALESHGYHFARLSPGQPQLSTTPFAGINDKQAAKELVNHIIEHGHKDIAIITGPTTHGAAYHRLEGYFEALNEADITPQKQYQKTGLFDFSSGKNACQYWLSLKRPPTAIFACNDAMAAGVMHYAMSCGLTLPKDLSVVGFGDSPTAERLWPSLTTAKQPALSIAKICTQALINQLRKSDTQTFATILTHQVILRDSVTHPPLMNQPNSNIRKI